MATTSTLLATDNQQPPSPNLYEKAVAVLRERYFDKAFSESRLDELAQQYRPCASAAPDVNAQRECLTKLLAHLPASHLGLLSEESFNYFMGELSGEQRPTFGLHALRMGKDYFSFFVLEGGPAAAAGVLPWERIVSIDGHPIARSPRLDYAQKDAHLSIDRDPPVHSILCREGNEVTLGLERNKGRQRSIKLRARPYSALAAAKASARMIKVDGRNIGYVHFWFIHTTGVLELLRDLFDGSFATAEGLLLDLRGRGGNGVVVPPMVELLSNWGRPIVALTDRQSRSAKDALAYEFKQRKLATVVGERTAGAVIPASFEPLGDETVLMFPSFTLGDYTKKLELKGLEPDISVERAGPYSAGHDPILERGTKELLRLAQASEPSERRLAQPTQPAKNSFSPRAAEEVPKLEELIRKMVDALGGEKSLRAHQHRTLAGTTELIGLPMKGDFVQKASAPDKSLIVMNLGDLRIKQGVDGATAWSETSMQGLQILRGPMADALRQQAKFYGPLDLIASNKEVTPIGIAKFDDRECVELKVVGSGGGLSNLYVDAANHLIAGTKATIETPIGAIESKTYFRDYKQLDGFTTATEILIESSVQRQLIRIERISFEPIQAEEYLVPARNR